MLQTPNRPPLGEVSVAVERDFDLGSAENWLFYVPNRNYVMAEKHKDRTAPALSGLAINLVYRRSKLLKNLLRRAVSHVR
jgi:hypothetical protein